jgi:hypothetical protein
MEKGASSRAKEAAEERKMLDDLNYPENLDL